MTRQTKTRLSASEYYQLSRYQQADRIELMNGDVIVDMPPPTPKHQALVGEILFFLLSVARQQGGQAFTAPIEVYFDPQHILQPDVIYLAPQSACVVDEKCLTGAPDMVVEVLSPSTAKYDRQDKFVAYERFGVREYWLVDPLYDVIEIWVRQGEHLARLGVFGVEDTVTSTVLGASLALREVFRS